MTTAAMTTASMTTAAMTTTDGTSTGMPPEETTTGNGTTMAPADSSGTEGPGSSEGTASGTTTGGAGDAAYPQCMLEADPVCPEGYDDCAQLMMGNYNFCTVACEAAGDCPAPSSGDAVAICGGPMQNRCELDCGDGATCPDGMDCLGVGPGNMLMRCAWPAN